jgi:hypothetical protein
LWTRPSTTFSRTSRRDILIDGGNSYYVDGDRHRRGVWLRADGCRNDPRALVTLGQEIAAEIRAMP